MKQNVPYTQPPSTFGRVDQLLPSTLPLAVGTKMSYSLHCLRQRDVVFCSQGQQAIYLTLLSIVSFTKTNVWTLTSSQCETIRERATHTHAHTHARTHPHAHAHTCTHAHTHTCTHAHALTLLSDITISFTLGILDIYTEACYQYHYYNDTVIMEMYHAHLHQPSLAISLSSFTAV